MTTIADSISSDQAAAAIAAAQAKAAAIGVAANIAVLDAGTHLKAFVRMDGAVLGSIDVATAKAAPRSSSPSPAPMSGPTASPALLPRTFRPATAA